MVINSCWWTLSGNSPSFGHYYCLIVGRLFQRTRVIAGPLGGDIVGRHCGRWPREKKSLLFVERQGGHVILKFTAN